MRSLVPAFLLALIPSHHKARPDIPIIHQWIVEPFVTVCPDSPMSFERVMQAVEWTKERGARWAYVATGACDGEIAYGEVRVTMLPLMYTLEYGAAGATMIEHADFDGSIAADAMVGISFNVDPANWVLEHELLHAQGLDHHTMTESVMCRSVQCGGWDDAGIADALARVWALRDQLVGDPPASLAAPPAP